MIKLKARPEDFVVEEDADLPFRKDGNFCVYLLKKRGWNTVDVLKNIAKKLSLPYADFSYGGKKDKYALTSQYITIARQGYERAHLSASHALRGEDGGGVKSPQPVHRRNSRCPSAITSADIEKLIPTTLGKENYALKFVGYMERPMGPDLIKGNRFRIVVRNLTGHELKSALNELEVVRRDGYPNYFDDQRFGSYDSRQGFVAEKILKKHYNGALKLYFSGIHPEDSNEEKERRKFFYENWGNWQECLKGAAGKFEKEAFRYLEKHPGGFIPILQRISHEKMVLFFSAYQSHLWNEVLRKIIRSVSGDSSVLGNSKAEILRRFTAQKDTIRHSEQCEESDSIIRNSKLMTSPLKRGDEGVCKNAFDTPPAPLTRGELVSRCQKQPNLKISTGIAGDYLFYTQVDDRSKAYLSTLVIPMPASNIKMPDAFTRNFFSEVLAEHDLKTGMFNIRKIRQAFFKGIERKAVIYPENLFIEHANDEMYPGRKKLTLQFFLPRGCFGTMLVKRLVC